MKIVKATKKDWKEFKRLKRESLDWYSKLIKEKIHLSDKDIKKEFDEFSQSKNKILIIAKDSETKGYLIGSLLINAYTKTGYIDDVFVSANFRGKGIGKKLISEFKIILRKKHIKKMRLGVNPKNKNAIKLYKKLRFKITHYEMEKKL